MRRRTSGSTQMNAISSRSHVVFTLYCDRVRASVAGRPATPLLPDSFL